MKETKFSRSHLEANASASRTGGLAAKESGLNRFPGGIPQSNNPELGTLRDPNFGGRQNPVADAHLRRNGAKARSLMAVSQRARVSPFLVRSSSPKTNSQSRVAAAESPAF